MIKETQLTVNPFPSLTACANILFRTYFEEYSGRSMMLKQVWATGK